jgi:hypothetical protein
MSVIWSIIEVFGFVSLLVLVLGIWAHFDMQKEKRQNEQRNKAESDKRL